MRKRYISISKAMVRSLQAFSFLIPAFCSAQGFTGYTISTIAGNTFDQITLNDGGPATKAGMSAVRGVARDAAGNVYIADGGHDRVRKVAPNGIITTFAGNGQAPGNGVFSGAGGLATNATLAGPGALAVDAAGNVYISDGNSVRKVAATGIITTFAGNEQAADSGDGGPATGASLFGPQALAVDSAGNLYIGEFYGARVRKVTLAGIISTVAGGGLSAPGDGGSATQAKLTNVTGVAVDTTGNLYIADSGNSCVRKVSPGGIITTAAGQYQVTGYTGDNGPATSATFFSPTAVAVDTFGNLLISDTFYYVVREVLTSGTIVTAAGTGTSGNSGDGGPATSAKLNDPVALYPGPLGTVYIAESGLGLIRLLTPIGATTGGGTPAVTEVDNGFSNVPNSPIQSGAWVVIKGTNLSNTNPGRGWNANENFPTTMDGTSVTINNKPAFMYFISPTQVNVQAPTDTALGPVSVVVTNNGQVSASATAQYQSNSPALLQWGGGQYPYALITRGSDYIGNAAVVSGTVSAKAGDALTLWATGLGATNPPLPAGQQPSTFPPVTNMPTVTVAGTSVTVLGAVLRYAGLYQVNIQLPASLPTGDSPIKVIQGSFQSPDGVLINVQP